MDHEGFGKGVYGLFLGSLKSMEDHRGPLEGQRTKKKNHGPSAGTKGSLEFVVDKAQRLLVVGPRPCGRQWYVV